jgi:hypothetical protein
LRTVGRTIRDAAHRERHFGRDRQLHG